MSFIHTEITEMHNLGSPMLVLSGGHMVVSPHCLGSHDRREWPFNPHSTEECCHGSIMQ